MNFEIIKVSGNGERTVILRGGIVENIPEKKEKKKKNIYVTYYLSDTTHHPHVPLSSPPPQPVTTIQTTSNICNLITNHYILNPHRHPQSLSSARTINHPHVSLSIVIHIIHLFPLVYLSHYALCA